MAVPVSRNDFKKYCLRKLGAPVVKINVDDDQVEDRVDEAIQYFREYHYDATEKCYLPYMIRDVDKTNKWIPIPPEISDITGVFPIGAAINPANMFNVQYQLTLSDVWYWSSAQYQNYYTDLYKLANIQEIFVGKQAIRFARHTDKLYIDGDWDQVVPGNFVIVECYRILDPNVYTEIWNDLWLKKYATALVKLQWGDNMKKFGNMQLPGGVIMNGQTIYDEAKQEITKLEEEVVSRFSLPPEFATG